MARQRVAPDTSGTRYEQPAAPDALEPKKQPTAPLVGFSGVVETPTTLQPHHKSTEALFDEGDGGKNPPSLRLVRQDTMFTFKGSLDAAKYVSSQQKIKGRPWYILHPHSTALVMWDTTTSFALLFTAAVTPFEVSFMDSGDSFTLFVINRVIDLIFIFDMCLQFVIMQQVDIQGSHSARTRHCICALFSLSRVHCVWYRST